MIRNWVKKAGYRFHSSNRQQKEERDMEQQENENKSESGDDGGPRPMDVDPKEQEEKNNNDSEEGVREEDEMRQAAPEVLVVRADKPDCISAPGTMFSRKRNIICMDDHGTVIRKKQRGHKYFNKQLDQKLLTHSDWKSAVQMQDIVPFVSRMESIGFFPAHRVANEAEAFENVGVSRRWSGLGPEPPHLQEVMPDSVSNTQDGTLWEIDGIVEHKRTKNGTVKYLVRYRGYGPEYDEWFEEAALDTAPGAIKVYWARNAWAS